jgi:hypothetical protein
MNKIDLIIDALYKTKLLFESHGQYPHTLREVDEALAAARELKALKPVAWMLPEYGDVLPASQADGTGIYNIPLYTAPPRKPWVGLTDEERNEMRSIVQGHTKIDAPTYGLTLQYATEEVLKEKNNAV